jgi:hypothetical protein
MDLLFTLKPLGKFPKEMNSHKKLGIITEDLTEKKIFVCFLVNQKYKFFEARDYQLLIIKKICESEDKDIFYQEFTEYGIIQARGFKFILDNSSYECLLEKKVDIPIIGYMNDRNEKIYVIPMSLHENKTIFRFEEIGNSKEYNIFDKEKNKIEIWPPC